MTKMQSKIRDTVLSQTVSKISDGLAAENLFLQSDTKKLQNFH